MSEVMSAIKIKELRDEAERLNNDNEELRSSLSNVVGENSELKTICSKLHQCHKGNEMYKKAWSRYSEIAYPQMGIK